MSRTLWMTLGVVFCCSCVALAPGGAWAQRQQDDQYQREQEEPRFDQQDPRSDRDAQRDQRVQDDRHPDRDAQRLEDEQPGQRTPGERRFQDGQQQREGGADDQRSQQRGDQPAGLGVSVSEGRQQGVRVELVHDGSPAQEAGLREGDQILQVGGQQIESVQDLISTIQRMNPGRTVEIQIVRDGRRQTLEATLETREAALNEQQQMRFYRSPATPWSDDDISAHITSLEQEIRRLADEIRDLKAMLDGDPSQGERTRQDQPSGQRLNRSPSGQQEFQEDRGRGGLDRGPRTRGAQNDNLYQP